MRGLGGRAAQTTNRESIRDENQSIPLLGGICLLIVLMLAVKFAVAFGRDYQQFSYLAQSFLHGKPHFITMPGPSWGDCTYFSGHYYWPPGPFPAVLLMPFVWLFGLYGHFCAQVFVHIPVAFCVIGITYKLARTIGYSSADAIYLTMAFCIGSIFLWQMAIPASWFYAQVVATGFLMCLLWLSVSRRLEWLQGVCIACLFATRATAGLGALAYALASLFVSPSGGGRRRPARSAIRLLLPSVLAILAIMQYNHVRFGSYFESGYRHQILGPPLPASREYGLLSLKHLPADIYFVLMDSPDPVFKEERVSWLLQFPYLRPGPAGVSLLWSAPYLLSLFWLVKRERTQIPPLIATAVAGAFVFTYYAPRSRYALDFLPYLFLLMCQTYFARNRNLSQHFRYAILATCILDMCLLLSDMTMGIRG